jgi:hypothetical protein
MQLKTCIVQNLPVIFLSEIKRSRIYRQIVHPTCFSPLTESTLLWTWMQECVALINKVKCRKKSRNLWLVESYRSHSIWPFHTLQGWMCMSSCKTTRNVLFEHLISSKLQRLWLTSDHNNIWHFDATHKYISFFPKRTLNRSKFNFGVASQPFVIIINITGSEMFCLLIY